MWIYIAVYAHGSPQRMMGFLFHYSPYFLKAGSLAEPGARQSDNRPSHCPIATTSSLIQCWDLNSGSQMCTPNPLFH